VMDDLAATQPTSGFGEMFQYSNGLAAAAGFVDGHVLYPDLELGAAYDLAMQREVFDPLGMSETTFDFSRALSGNHSSAHSTSIDGVPSTMSMDPNGAVIHMRPAGGAWSNVNDMLKYISMELAGSEGGQTYISQEALLARRDPQVAVSQHESYGMGLRVDNTYGVQVVHHGGVVFGHHSGMMWLPEHKIGAVVLTNGDPGWLIRSHFRRKLLEVLFDGKPEADAAIAADSKRYYEEIAAKRGLYMVPADSAVAEDLSRTYSNPSLGQITVVRHDGNSIFDFGEWNSEVASKANPDGTVSFVTTDAGVAGFEFVVGSSGEPTLTLRDAQHEYVFTATQE